MAKKDKYFNDIPILWNGHLMHPMAGQKNQSIPNNIAIIWGNNSYSWSDVNFIIEIADGIGTGSRRAREARLNKLIKEDKVKKKKLIHLICRVKGEKVYDNIKEIDLDNIKITLEDVDLVTRRVLGQKSVSLVVEVGDEIIENTKLVEDYE
ncbi:hypothetical protein CL614_10335 [archaeon]|jgi:hypothetical protein|nr:hypothetical protein [archaeon]|tara:strand:+ start:645 stop:1097 length:453 start_codon:yes stop_codon:yes gene_type:complete